MARILSVTSGFPSILYPSVELARRLAASGHEVTFAGLASSRDLVEHQGLSFQLLQESGYEAFLQKDSQMAWWRRLWTLGARRRRALSSMALQSFVQTIQELEPDLILIDGEMHEHILAATSSRVPVVLLNSFASIWRRPGLPPNHCLVRPGFGWQGSSLGMKLLWAALRWKKWRRSVSQWLRRVGCDRLSLLKLVAKEAGFDFRHQTDASQWLMPFTYRSLPVLSLHALEFDFPHQAPEHVHYVGPLLLESRIDRQLREGDQEKLEALLAKHRQRRAKARAAQSVDGEQLRHSGALIYAGFGSVLSTDLDFLKRLFGMVQERPDWDLVVSVSDRLVVSDLGEIPERVHVFSWVPQMTVVRNADVVITHGGINTIDECVLIGGSERAASEQGSGDGEAPEAPGAPMLIYCGFETDMAGNTARVVHHGIGIAGDRVRDSSEEIRNHVDRLLVEPSFRENLRRLGRSYRAYQQQGVAEGAVQGLLESAPSSLREKGQG